MSKLDDALASFNRIEGPEIWPDVLGRHPQSSRPPGPSGPRRVGVALLALAVAAAGFTLAVRTFGRSTERGTSTTTPTAGSPKAGVLASFDGIGILNWSCSPTGIGGQSPYQMTYTVYRATERVQVRSQGALSERAVLQPGDELVVRPQGPGFFELRAVQATEPQTVVATARARIPTGNGCQPPSVRSSVAMPRPVVGG